MGQSMQVIFLDLRDVVLRPKGGTKNEARAKCCTDRERGRSPIKYSRWNIVITMSPAGTLRAWSFRNYREESKVYMRSWVESRVRLQNTLSQVVQKSFAVFMEPLNLMVSHSPPKFIQTDDRWTRIAWS